MKARRLLLHYLFATGVGLLLFLYRHLENVASRDRAPFLSPLITEVTAAWIAATLFFGVRALARRHPLDGPGWARRLPAHVAGVAAYAVSATSLMWATRSLLFPLAGLGPYDYGRMPHRYFMELPVQLMIYALMLTGVHVADRYRVEREERLLTAQLQARLSEARLQNLELQLQPHFLFNALNTIASTMYDDPAAADEMVSHLAELLRRSLRRPGPEVPLREELAALGHYLSLLKARFGDDLNLTLEVPADTLDLLVPSLLLQPLVENAVRHGRASTAGAGRIEIEARRDQDALTIAVRDDGPGAPVTDDGTGLGLSVTRERLRLLYGGGHHFEAGPQAGGGFRVVMRLPLRSVPRQDVA
jgi:two-component system, LytTR family, sensor kinase